MNNKKKDLNEIIKEANTKLPNQNDVSDKTHTIPVNNGEGKAEVKYVKHGGGWVPISTK